MENFIDLNFVHQFLACNYATFYTNPNMREDLVSEAVLEICEHAKEYDSEIASFKAWSTPHIKRGALKFFMKLHNLSEHYEKMRAKAYRLIAEAALCGETVNLYDILPKKAAYEISCSLDCCGLTGVERTSTTLDEEINAKETMSGIEEIMAILSEKERAIIYAKAESYGEEHKREVFYQKAEEAGISKKEATKCFNRASLKARKFAYKSEIAKDLLA